MNESPARDRALARWQALSGLAFGTFLALHLANTVAAALGQRAYDEVQGALRWYYQFPLVELLAVGAAALTHVVCGLLRLRARRQRAAGRSARAPLWLRIHRAGGYFMLLVLAGHVLATRGMVLFLDQPVDFSYLTFSLTEWPNLFFPYYVLLFTSGVVHGTLGTLAALSTLGLRAPGGALRRRLVAGVVVAMLAGGLVGILAMGGVLGEPDTGRFEEYRAFYLDYAPWFLGE